ncbi:hypothetical protein WM2015_1681 [Wenzhouxiangella marina]|uniref:Uncharacterized protein n=2 Tax=Wenzhouxiangella marina TaxID=1579979 RepID=A0A0K0XWQ7_9GAMM|nr:hypothetical protein WM2015_1681 [Wenzhouxiangella marina]
MFSLEHPIPGFSSASKTMSFHSRDRVRLRARHRFSTRLDSIDHRGPGPTIADRNKASVELEAALILVVVLAVAVILDAASWTLDARQVAAAIALSSYAGAVLSPDRSFCDRLEMWLQVLLGQLLAWTLLALDGWRLLDFLLAIPAGLLVAVLANFVQRQLWDWV